MLRLVILKCKLSEKVRKYVRKCSIPVIELAGEGGLTVRLVNVLLAVFCLNANFNVHAG